MRRLPLLALIVLVACKSAPPPPPAPEAPPPPPAPEAPPPPPVAPKAPPPAPDPTLPERTVFSGNPDFAGPSVSPDGKLLAYLAPHQGVLNVFVAPVDKLDQAAPLTQVKDRPIRNYHWAYDGQHVLYEQDQGGDENFHIFAVDLKTKAVRDLTPVAKARAMLLELSPDKKGELLVGLNERDPKHFDVHKIELKTGKRTLVFQNEAGYSGMLTDEALNVRFVESQRPDGGKDLLKVGPKGQVEPFWSVPMSDGLSTALWRLDGSGKTLYAVDSRERNTSGLFAVDVASGKGTLLADDPKADIDDGLFHPKTGKLQAVYVTYERRRWITLDKSVEGDLAALGKELRGDFSVTSRSLDDQRWVVAEILDDGPVRYHRYDRAKKKLTFLFSNRKALENMALAKMHPVLIPSRDGLTLVSYLSLPSVEDPDKDGKPDRALPMVLLVHGGPWARDNWGFNSNHQWLASRGYAVLSVNFRGSDGFGKSFLNAANGEWAGKMHDDLIDAVEWAVKAGVARADKVAIMGGSYGGYATLVGLTFTPDRFACGVDIVGPSNIATLLATIPPYWAPLLNMFISRVGGDPRTEEGRKLLASRSPLSLVERIQRPLLIGQGANDPRVKQSESDQIVKAMNEKKIPVTYVLFADEGHGFARPENRLAFNAVAEAFLAQCLGGAYQAVGTDFKGSSVAVPAGAAEVVGLEAALQAPR